MKITLLLLLTHLTFSPTLLADEKMIEKELTSFAKLAINQEAEKPQQDSQKQSLLGIQSSIATKQYSQALNLIQAHIQLYPGSLNAASALSSAILADLTEQAEAEVERKKKFFNEFAKSLVSAKTIEEIDPWLIKLNEEIQRDNKHLVYTQPIWSPTLNFIPSTRDYSGFWTANTRYQSYCGMPNQLREETQTALRIATGWQDYLQALALGDKATARNHMNNVASYAASFVYIPRSKILRLSGELTPKNEIDQNSTTLLEIKDVEQRLKTLKDATLLYHELYNLSSSRLSSEVTQLKEELRFLKEAIDYLNGDNFTYGIQKLQGLKSSAYLGDLAHSVLTEHVRSALKLPDDIVINKEDNSQAWADKYLDQLASEKKWGELRQAIIIISSGRQNSNMNPRAQDIEALQMLIAGQNYQDAELYHNAAVAYRQILGKAVYTKAINEEATSQLKKLRKEQPMSYLLSHDMYDHESNNISSSREDYLKKLIEIELKKVAKEMQGEKKNEQQNEE